MPFQQTQFPAVAEHSRWDLDSLPRWTLHEDFRIGGPEGPDAVEQPEYRLTFVREVRLGAEGEIYVAQDVEEVIRIFGTEGALIRTLGRPGEGPGEFRSVRRIGVTDSLLWVGDDRLERVTFFSPDGEVADVISRFASPRVEHGRRVFPSSAPDVLLPDGSGLVEPSALDVYRVAELRDADGRPEYQRPLTLYLRIWPGSERADTVAMVLGRKSRTPTVREGGNEAHLADPTSGVPMSATALDGSGVVIVYPRGISREETSRFAVAKIAPDGDTAWSVDHDFEPIRVSETWLDAFIDSELRRLTYQTVVTSNARAVRAALDGAALIREQLTTITDLVVGQDGTIWLARERDTDATRTWTAVSSTGDLIGQLRLDAQESIVASRGSMLVTHETGSLDVPMLTRYTIRRDSKEDEAPAGADAEVP